MHSYTHTSAVHSVDRSEDAQGGLGAHSAGTCMHVCMYVCMYAFQRKSACVCVMCVRRDGITLCRCVYVCMYVCMHFSKSLHACMHACMPVCMCLCNMCKEGWKHTLQVCVCMYVYMYAFQQTPARWHACMYVCMC